MQSLSGTAGTIQFVFESTYHGVPGVNQLILFLAGTLGSPIACESKVHHAVSSEPKNVVCTPCSPGPWPSAMNQPRGNSSVCPSKLKTPLILAKVQFLN